MRHFVNFGVLNNIRNSSGKQRLGTGAGLLGLAAGGYAAYRGLKDNPDAIGDLKEQYFPSMSSKLEESFDDSNQGFQVPEYLKGGGDATPLNEVTEDKFGMPISRSPNYETLGAGTNISDKLKGTVEQVYRNRPNTPRDNIYDAIREPDLRGEQFRQTGERLGTVLGSAGEKLGGAAKATGIAVYDNLKPKPSDLQVRPEDYLSGKYNLDNLSNDDRVLIYEKMNAKGILGADRILTRSLNRPPSKTLQTMLYNKLIGI
jgi:hypothetical protein